eukprot:1034139-Prymnesium_polylepis.1
MAPYSQLFPFGLQTIRYRLTATPSRVHPDRSATRPGLRSRFHDHELLLYGCSPEVEKRVLALHFIGRTFAPNEALHSATHEAWLTS